MEQAVRIILPLYFAVYFGLAFVAKSVMVAKRIGKSPLVLPKNDTAYGLVGQYFKLTLMAMFLYVLVFSLFPKWYVYALPVPQLRHKTMQLIGLGLMAFSLGWTMIAQANMKNAWRIGIDTETKTELITGGLFRYSRNPVFLGMIISLLALVFVTPNALTIIFLITGFMLIQIQIRLEEEHLKNLDGQAYVHYMNSVRRLI